MIFAYLVAIAVAIQAEPPKQYVPKAERVVPGLVVSAPIGQMPRIWLWPDRGIEPSKISPKDLSLHERVLTGLMGEGAPLSFEVKNAQLGVFEPRSLVMKKLTIDEISSELKKCDYVQTVIVRDKELADPNVVYGSSFKCGPTNKAEHWSFVSIVIRENSVAGVYLLPKGGFPVVLKEDSHG